VRRDAEKLAVLARTSARCASLAGASPAWVSAGAPSSRLPCVAEEIPSSKRSVKSLPKGGSKEAGRNQVNAEQASSDYQPKGDWESRAGHAAAKATDIVPVPERTVDLPGVLAAARFEREVRNTRDPSRRPTSGEAIRISRDGESGSCRAGVRGARSTSEGGNKPLEGRGPALVVSAMKVSARAWA
jgi:hypothetical protein